MGFYSLMAMISNDCKLLVIENKLTTCARKQFGGETGELIWFRIWFPFSKFSDWNQQKSFTKLISWEILKPFTLLAFAIKSHDTRICCRFVKRRYLKMFELKQDSSQQRFEKFQSTSKQERAPFGGNLISKFSKFRKFNFRVGNSNLSQDLSS